MKKIGIITIVDNNNYGNRLQNYAATQVFEKMGFQADTLMINKRRGNIKYIPRAIKMMLEPISEKYKLQKKDPLSLERIRRFELFNAKNGINIKKYILWNKILLQRKYDFFSVGSDQIWNYNLGYGHGTEFLDFAASEQRITFSPSFGTAHISGNQKQLYIQGLSGFKYLSVREKSGAELIHELTGQTAEVIIDPTMMLTAEDWMKVEKKPENVDTDSPYVLEYFLGGRRESIEKNISEFAQDKHLNRIMLLDRKFPELYCTDPAEFIYLIHHAELIATDSFHATVFSILFERPFAIYERIEYKEMGSRIMTLLDLFDTSENVFAGISDIRRFSNEKTKIILKRERNRGYAFLRKEMGISENE